MDLSANNRMSSREGADAKVDEVVDHGAEPCRSVRLRATWRACRTWVLGCAAPVLVAGVATLGLTGYQELVERLTPDYRYELHALALPAKPASNPTWGVEVDAFASKVTRAFGVRATTAQEFSGWILEASERHEFAPELIASLVLTESSFRKSVRSHVGALGPAQVRPEMWGRFCGASDLTDPAENIYCGAQVLAHLREQCGGNTCALKAYNIGQYSKRHEAGNRYVAKIDEHRDRLEAL